MAKKMENCYSIYRGYIRIIENNMETIYLIL